MQKTKNKNQQARKGDGGYVESRVQNQKRHKRRRRRNNATLYLMVLIFIVTVGLILIFTVFFKIVGVEVAGLSRYEAQQIIDASGIVAGENMFRLNRTEIEDKLVKEYSYFEKVRLKYNLPDAITIEVTEAQPVGAVQQGESYLLISAGGRVLESTAAPAEGLPIIKGFHALAVNAGDTLESLLERMRADAKLAAKAVPEETAEQRALKKEALQATESLANELESKVNMMKAFFAAAEETGFAGVNTLDLSDKFNLVAETGSALVEFGAESELVYKMQCAQEVLQNKLGVNFKGKIDVSKAGWVRVRHMSAEAQGMTADEYAEYLYRQSGGGVVAAENEEELAGGEAAASADAGAILKDSVESPADGEEAAAGGEEASAESEEAASGDDA